MLGYYDYDIYDYVDGTLAVLVLIALAVAAVVLLSGV